MIGSEGRDGGREGRGERRLAWPPAPGSDLGLLAAELAAGIDGAAEGGSALALIELAPGGAAAAMQLCERLAAHWQAAGQRCLVVDGHPTAPFFDVLFPGSPEGFTEILHYGLSPAAAAQERPHCAGLWIPAGGRWALPLESPDEPELTLSRLLGEAERVLLLADAGDAEGLLSALREGCHFLLGLEAAPPAAEPVLSSSRPPAPPRSPAETAVPSRAPRRGLAARRASGRRVWAFVLLPAGALLLLLGVYLITGSWGGGDQTSGRSVERGAGDAFSPLPAPAELPYAAPPGEAGDSSLASAERAVATVSPAQESAQEPPVESAPRPPGGGPAGSAPAGLSAPVGASLPPAATPAAAPRTSSAARAGGLQRRFEPEGAWSRLLGAPGPFYVHLESFRDSALAAEAARGPAAQRLGVRLAPALVEGVRWYRLWLGPFADLSAAAACRDSLLDRAGEDYCRIVTPSP